MRQLNVSSQEPEVRVMTFSQSSHETFAEKGEGKKYIKLLLPCLIALLMISALVLAWSVRSWTPGRSGGTLAENQSAPASSQAKPDSSLLVAGQAGSAVVAGSGNTSRVQPQEAHLKQSSVPVTIDASQGATLAAGQDRAYVQSLAAQYQDRGKTTALPANEALAQRINAADHSQASQGQVVDVVNKVIIPTGSPQMVKGVQGELSGLVTASLQALNTGTTEATQQVYLQGLHQEAGIRENEARTVVVQTGDTLSAIAVRVYGDAGQYPKIFRANPTLLLHPDKIYIGQVLRVPR